MTAQRDLKIKTNVCKRLLKDLDYYEKEIETQSKKVQEMIAANVCPYDIKKQKENLQESEAMIPETRMRLKQAASDLEELLDMNSQDETFVQLPDYEEARKALESAQR